MGFLRFLIFILLVWLLLSAIGRFFSRFIDGKAREILESLGINIEKPEENKKTTELKQCPKCGVFVSPQEEHICKPAEKEAEKTDESEEKNKIDNITPDNSNDNTKN